jgi:hypothetical protein
MKRAVSISIGSSKRDKLVEINILGQTVQLERIGTDGDMKKAAQLYADLDGKVDAFGVGGTDLGLMVDRHWYPLYSVASLVKGIHQTPVVDGYGLRFTLESLCGPFLNEHLAPYLDKYGRRVLVTSAVDRWGMSHSFASSGYECIYGDLLFSLGVGLPLRSERWVKILAAILMPVMGRVPFHWIYPTGEQQDKRTPRWENYFSWANIIAGDCHYITRYMPDHMEGKVIVTNTTTPQDREMFCSAGVKYLLTTTPVLDGRSFGTNMMEAALVAASGRRDPIDYRHSEQYLKDLQLMVREMEMQPQLQELS